MEPNNEYFVYDIENFPVFFNTPTKKERDYFTNNLNSLSRKFFKKLRKYNYNIFDDDVSNPMISCMTNAEFALIIIRNKYRTRKKRQERKKKKQNKNTKK